MATPGRTTRLAASLSSWKIALVLGIVCFGMGVTRLSQIAQSQQSTALKYADHDLFYLPWGTATTIKSTSLSHPVRLPKFPVISKPDPFPPLHEIVHTMKNGTNATAAQFILDIAIVGFAKCGTTTMSKEKK